jgi:branched-chain amino acid transport system substrate-binding protein
MKRIWLLGVAFVLIGSLLFSPGLTQQQLPKEIVIGGPISLAGTYAKEGQQGYWGFLVAEKWVNEVYGGVRLQGQRIPIKYKYYDDESKKENVTSLLERLITVDGGPAAR